MAAHHSQQFIEFFIARVRASRVGSRIPNRMGDFAGDLAVGDAVSDPAQVFKQNHPQRGRQRPQLAEAQFINFLVSVKKCCEQVRVKHAVGMCNIGPGYAINTRKTLKWLVGEFGEIGVVAPRYAFMDLLKLRFDQMEIVEQPLSGRCDVVAAAGTHSDIVISLAQSGNVFFDARKK